ncbi:MAG: hypothetical protein C5B59_20170 [Bacteroidetes bacterium]|nr:MAG: hypothetical protein C5B59_20170 [Bacteroidota bacterium]
MYNPFPPLNEKLLKDKIAEGKRYFVRQTYERGMQPRIRAAFLFRGYEENEKNIADLHFQKLQADPNAFLYDAQIGEHMERLIVAARQPFGFKIFYAGKKGIDWRPPPDYQSKMQKYIAHHHPNWRTKSGGDKIQVGLYEEFGQLFLKLSFEQEEDKIPFDEIEKY